MPSSNAPKKHCLTLCGLLTLNDLNQHLEKIVLQKSGQNVLLVDASEMHDFKNAARIRFIEWNREHQKDLHGVAIITEKKSWRLIISTMGLASGQQIKAFTHKNEAESWLNAAAETFSMR